MVLNIYLEILTPVRVTLPQSSAQFDLILFFEVKNVLSFDCSVVTLYLFSYAIKRRFFEVLLQETYPILENNSIYI